MIYFIFEGKTKDSFVEEMEREYVKRISGFTKCELRQVNSLVDAKLPDGHVILLDEKGKSFSSLDFAQKFLKPRYDMGETLVFLIAGAFGPGDAYKKALKEKGASFVRLSDLTFTHQIARVVLCEQVYRALTILHGKQYHY